MSKKLQFLTLFLSIGIFTTTFTQTVQSNFINYQGVASNAAGEVMVKETIIVGIALKFGASNVAADYTESHNLTTDANGVFSLQIGNGSNSTSNYNNLPWHFARFVTISINGTEIGTTELLAVPYAIRAGNGGGATKIDDLQDAKSDNDGTDDGSSIFLGVDAGKNDNGTDNGNVGVGYRALYSNTIGNYNTANGYTALYFNTTGDANTANGFSALLSNTTGYNNTANGRSALASNTKGSLNTANGRRALHNNTTGNFNTANGHEALHNNTTGNLNTANGYQALNNNTTGNNNIGIGYNTQVPNGTGSNQVRIGNAEIIYAGVQVPWTITSDAAWKDDIQPLPYGLNMVSQLKPVDYVRKNNETNTREIGFIAQDVELLLNKLGYNNNGMLTSDDEGHLSLRYNDFIPILTAAVQEQQTIIDRQNDKIEVLSDEVSTTKKDLTNILTRVIAMEKEKMAKN